MTTSGDATSSRQPHALPSRRVVLGAAAALALASAVETTWSPFSLAPAHGAVLIPYRFPFPLADIDQAFGHNGHRGTDFSEPLGTPIPAVAAGTVSATGNDGDGIYPYGFDYGTWVLIAHADGMSSFYAHMSSRSVSNGQSVQLGATIGAVGHSGGRPIPGISAGATIGNHLHLGLTPTGTSAFQDPIPYIDARLTAVANTQSIDEDDQMTLILYRPAAGGQQFYVLTNFSLTNISDAAHDTIEGFMNGAKYWVVDDPGFAALQAVVANNVAALTA